MLMLMIFMLRMSAACHCGGDLKAPSWSEYIRAQLRRFWSTVAETDPRLSISNEIKQTFLN